MADKFQTMPMRFVLAGLDLNRPVDALKAGKYAILKNVRSYQEGRIEGRPGLAGGALIVPGSTNVHSVRRLNDENMPDSTYAYIVGTGRHVCYGQTGFTDLTDSGATGFHDISDSGASGDPLSMVSWRPSQSPHAWMYVADRLWMRKVRTDGLTHTVGLSAPMVPPSAAIGQPQYVTISDFEATTGWTESGTAGAASLLSAGPGRRVNTTITRILYDSGTTGWCSVQPAAMTGIGTGVFLTYSGTAETKVVQSIHPAITSTTVSRIVYDTGTTGDCSVYFSITPYGLRVNSLLLINTEAVRIKEVIQGHDGTLSIRCTTTSAHSESETVTGLASYRTYLDYNHSAAQTVQTDGVRSTVTTGIGYLTKTASLDLSVIGSRPAQKSDYIHLSIRLNTLNNLTEGKILFDVDSATNDFTRNYYYFAFRPDDFAAAAAGEITMLTAQQRAMQRQIIESYEKQRQQLLEELAKYPEYGGYLPAPAVIDPLSMTPASFTQGYDVREQIRSQLEQLRLAQELMPSVGQLAVGDNVWMEIRFRVSELTRVGTDESRTLANVAAIRVSFDVTADTTCDLESWWIGGSYGPDVGELGEPYNYRYRARVSSTGATSGFSPPMRSGITPKRQQVVVTLPQHSGTGVDFLDVYRWGGLLTDWFYVGSVSNTPGSTSSSSSGPSAPSSAVNATYSGTNEVEWTNPGYATASDDSRATISLGASPVQHSAYLKLTGLGFSIDIDDIITGIEVSVEGQRTGTGTARVYAIKGGTVVTSGYQSSNLTAFDNTDSTVVFGGSTTMFGSSWTPADINSSDFGVAFWVQCGGVDTTTFADDTVTVTIYTLTAIPTFTDIYPDDAIITNPLADLDHYQPWPVRDFPKSGYTSQVSGTTILDNANSFDTSWATGTLIRVNGLPYTIYRVLSTSKLEIYENAGNSGVVPWEVPEPIRLGQTLPVLFGPYEGFMFGCGDSKNPGRLYYTKGNDPDATREGYYLDVTPPSEELMNGCMYNGRAYLFSSERMFVIYPTFDQADKFRVLEVPNAKGLFTRWGLAVGPRIWGLGREGIYETVGGESISITDDDLRPLFPLEGNLGQTVNSYAPPNLVTAQVTSHRLSYADGYLYYDYPDTDGTLNTLVYDTIKKAWLFDNYASGVRTHYGAEGKNVHLLIAGGNDGRLYQVSGTSDGGTAIAAQVRTASVDLGDPRINKFFGDVYLDTDPNSATVSAVVGFNQHATTLAATTMSDASRSTAIIDVNSGAGQLARNIDLDVSWSSATANPKLYLWTPTYLAQPENTQKRTTDWDDAGYVGAKFIQGIIVEADTEGEDKTVQVQYDGGTVGTTLTINHNGRQQKPYSWTPFIAHQVRLIPTDTDAWRLFNWRWVFEPSPESTETWKTQGTTLAGQGYLHLRDAYISLESTTAVTFTINVDGTDYSYTVASTSGAHRKTYVPLGSLKGKVITFTLSSSAGFRLYQKDCEVRVKSWGEPGPYRVVRPFGDLSFESGARI